MSAILIGTVTLIYIGVAVTEYGAGHRGMALVFIGYALGNIGLIMEAAR